jgi:uncharacterized protein YyaL (SSP411 family)
MIREMSVEGGGFAATIDADSPGGEGAFYVWEEKEIDSLLGENSAFFKVAYGVSASGNWEGRNILHRKARKPLLSSDEEARLTCHRDLLFQARAEREPPTRDDKVLSDWNGLAISSLATAGTVFGNKRWSDAARNAFAFICDAMLHHGRLLHCWNQGQAKHTATLDDYAYMIHAALSLFETSGDESYVDRAIEWVAILDRHYSDRDKGGYFFTPDDASDLILRTRTAHDHATPSGNGMMVQVLATLFMVTGKDVFRQRAQAVLDAFGGEAAKGFTSLATLVSASDMLSRPLHVVILGDKEGKETKALIGESYKQALPNMVISVYEDFSARPATHPLNGKEMISAKPTAYVCSPSGCLPPVTDTRALKDCLEGTLS